jgi:hypothetical protein
MGCLSGAPNGVVLRSQACRQDIHRRRVLKEADAGEHGMIESGYTSSAIHHMPRIAKIILIGQITFQPRVHTKYISTDPTDSGHACSSHQMCMHPTKKRSKVRTMPARDYPCGVLGEGGGGRPITRPGHAISITNSGLIAQIRGPLAVSFQLQEHPFSSHARYTHVKSSSHQVDTILSFALPSHPAVSRPHNAHLTSQISRRPTPRNSPR